MVVIYLGKPSLVNSCSLPTGIGRAALISAPLNHRHSQTREVRMLSGAEVPGLFGLTTRKVYRASGIAAGAVVSYTAFSPFPFRSLSEAEAVV